MNAPLFDTVPTMEGTALRPMMKHSLIVAGAFAAAIAGIGFPATREMTFWMLRENRPVEVATFALLLFGAVLALRFARYIRRAGIGALYTVFYVLFAAGLFVTAMEEVAWGQQFFGWATPEGLREVNVQEETTIHNIKGLHGNTEVMRLLFGLGGLAALAIEFFLGDRVVGARYVLLPWFAAITLHAAVDVVNDVAPIQREFDALISRLAELNELVIAVAGLLFVLFNMDRAASGGRAS